MKNLTFKVPNPIVKRIQQVAKEKDVTQSELIRRALEQFFCPDAAEKVATLVSPPVQQPTE